MEKERLSFVHQKAPLIIGVVREETPRAAVGAIRNCTLHGATAIDLHVSCLLPQYRTAEEMKIIVEKTALPIMALNYNQNYDRSFIGDDDETRLGYLLEAVKAGFSAVDMQAYSFKGNDPVITEEYSFTEGRPNEVVTNPDIIKRQIEFVDKVHDLGAEVIITNHPCCHMTTKQLLDYAHFLEQRKPDAIKIIGKADTEEELAEALESMIMLNKEISVPVGYLCNGDFGRITRIVNPLIGGHFTFCVDGYNEFTDFNQLDLQTFANIMENVRKMPEPHSNG